MKNGRGGRRPGAGRKKAQFPQTTIRIAAMPREKARIEAILSTRYRTEVLMHVVRELEWLAVADVLPSDLMKDRVVRWTGPIPSGWKLCDGTDGTPDFRSQFVLDDDSNPVVFGIIKID